MAQAWDDWGRHKRAAQRAPLLSAAREAELLKLAQAGDARAIQEVVASHMRLVVQVAARHGRSGLSPHDLVAEGVVGLLEALRRYDAARDSRFATYAVFWIRAHVSRFQQANRRMVPAPSTRAGRKVEGRLRRVERALTLRLQRAPTRSELAKALEVSEQDLEAAQAALAGPDLPLLGEELPEQLEGPESLVAEAELHHLREQSVTRALTLLSPRESDIVRERMADEGRSLSDMARELGISRQRTGQLLANACEKMRGVLEQVA